MRFCIYKTGSRAARIGALAPWGDDQLVDVHRAEVAWLASRTGSRRAHEVAEHLVPAEPDRFLTSGAHVWEFARDAVLAATPTSLTPRGDRVALPLAKVELLPVLDHLATTGEVVPDSERAEIEDPSAAPVLAIVRRLSCSIPRSQAWDHVAVYADLADDDRWLRMPNELAEGDTIVREAVAKLVSTASRAAILQPGDAVYSVRLTSQRAADALELALPA